MENNENEKNKEKIDILIWKHDIDFLDFLRTKKLAILNTAYIFQGLKVIEISEPPPFVLRSWKQARSILF